MNFDLPHPVLVCPVSLLMTHAPLPMQMPATSCSAPFLSTPSGTYPSTVPIGVTYPSAVPISPGSSPIVSVEAVFVAVR